MTTIQYSLGADPSFWGAIVNNNLPEPDDNIHNPDPRRDRLNDKGGSFITSRGLANLGCIIVLAIALVGLL